MQGFAQVPLLIILGLIGLGIIGGGGYLAVNTLVDKRVSEIEKGLVTQKEHEDVNVSEIQDKESAQKIQENKEVITPIKQTQHYKSDKDEVSTTEEATEAILVISDIRVIPSVYTASIRWNTSAESDATLTYWPAEGGAGNASIDSTGKTEHEVEVPTNPGTAYYFIIEASHDGKTVSSEREEYKTIFDIENPKILSVSIVKPANYAGFNISVPTSEPTKITIVYSYENALGEPTTERTLSTDEHNTNTVILVPTPTGGWAGGALIHYKISAYDRSANATTTEKYTKKLVEIPQTY